MNRLTNRFGKYVEIIGCKSLYDSEERKNAPASSAIARLAKYEDIGMTPDEINTVIAERNELLNYLHGKCKECKHYGTIPYEKPCGKCRFNPSNFGEAFYLNDSELSDNWEWEGIGDNR